MNGSTKFVQKDQDIQHLSRLITNIISRQKVSGQLSESDKQTRVQLQRSQRSINQLLQRINALADDNSVLSKENELLRQQNSILEQNRIIYLQKISKYQQKQSSKLKYVGNIEQLTPNTYTPITKLKPLNEFPNRDFNFLETYYDNINGPIGGSPTKDQIYRLNSYLIQYNTNIKLLLEKHNYFLKLRGIGIHQQDEERELIKNTGLIVKNKKVIDVSKSILKNSRRQYFESDQSSDIEEEYNNISI